MRDRSIRLRRSWYGRAAGGFPFQLLLALWGFLLPFRAVIDLADSRYPDAAAELAVAAVVLAVWIRGATAYAEVDDDGVRWRYWFPHRYRWTEIERVDLSLRNIGWTPWQETVVHTHRRRRVITPARTAGSGKYEFAHDLLVLARANGVATDVRWNEYVRRMYGL